MKAASICANGARRLAMNDKSDKIEPPAKPKERPLPRRPSYQRVVENIEKWANSSGLQKPT
jgi:hypothetical protein